MGMMIKPNRQIENRAIAEVKGLLAILGMSETLNKTLTRSRIDPASGDRLA